MGRIRFALSLLALHVSVQAAFVGSAQGTTAGQAPSEGDLRAAVIAEPGDLQRYFRLADFYRRQGRIQQADRTLGDALSVDPANPAVHERRVALFAKPFDPTRVGRIAQEWLSVDGTNPVPVLLAAGDRLRRASGLRGDGTLASQDEIEAGLDTVQGALPSNPNHSSLLLARAQLLEAMAALATDRRGKDRRLAEAWAVRQRVRAMEVAGTLDTEVSGPLVAVVQAMLQPVPFGPPGAVRADTLVPRPRLLTVPRMPASRIPAGVRPWGLALELVIDTHGHVVQVHPIDSTEGYDRAVADEVKRWIYEPTRLRGEPVSVIVNVLLPTRR